MKTPAHPITTVAEYIATFPRSTQTVLKQMRAIIAEVAPQAEQKISYGIPTFVLHGNLVHFGGYEKHVNLYPGASGIKAFGKELAGYTTSKGTVQFPLDQPLPIALIKKIVKFRVKENVTKANK